MRTILSFLIITFLFTGCKSSSKQLERGDYDAALQKAAKKIKRNPSKNDDEVVTNTLSDTANDFKRKLDAVLEATAPFIVTHIGAR